MFKYCHQLNSKWFGIIGVFVLQLFFICSIGVGQNTMVRGTVTDAESNETLPGVNVTIKGTTTGTSTDADGLYQLRVPSLADTLVFSFIGFATQTIPIDGRTEIDVVLTSQALVGEELIVVGYGEQRREDVTGSVGIVETENIRASSLTSPDEALIGQISGVNVTVPTGQPGSAPKIQVRGVGAVGAGNQPLFVVDGFAMPQPSNESEARFRNPLANIPVEDIKSMTVLKDASATAIYGSRGSNGVVIIETKSGFATTNPQVNISAYSGMQSDIEWMRPQMANARQFATWQNVVWQDRVDKGQVSEIPEPYRNPEQHGEGTDWYDLVRTTSFMHNLQASVSSGSETFQSFISAGFQNQEGIIPGTDFNRLSIRANFDADLSEGIRAGVRLAPSFTKRNQPRVQEGRGSSQGLPMLACPMADAYDEDGNVLPFVDASTSCPGGTWSHANPLYIQQNVKDEQNQFRAIGSAYLEFDLGPELSARSSLNADWAQAERQFFTPSTIGGINSPPPSVPSGGLTTENYLNFLSETTLNLAKDVGPGRLDALAGFTYQQENEISTNFTGVFPDNEIQTLNVASDISGSSNEQGWSLLSYLARANYTLLERFVFTGTIRVDGSSRFGAQNRWGTFPSGAVAWNLHNESFMAGLAENIIPELRIRTSFGVTGNNQIGNYQHLSTVTRDDYLLGNTIASGRRLTTLGNQQLGWERTNEWNVGLDISLFRRWNLSIEGYNRNTSDLLLNQLLPTTSGFSSVTTNIGEVRNRGLEISFSSVNVENRSFTWTTDLNWSLNRNTVMSLPEGEPLFTGGWGRRPTHMSAEGQPLGLMIGLIADGIYQNEQEIAEGPNDPGVIPGSIRWMDMNGDGVINAGAPPDGDYGVIGNPHPDFTFGITNTLGVGRFDARIAITGRVGGDVLAFDVWQSAYNVEGVFNVAADYVDNMWISEDQPGTMPTPLAGQEARNRFHQQQSLAVEDGSNLWVRNAMIRYNLPAGFAGVSTSNIYLSVQNPLILTPYSGNPEVERNRVAGSLNFGVADHSYPIARQFTVGLEVSF